ncbi:MAG: hypothetical protein COY40_03190 [Alphaproteobacteria bacterium CG_4_10_14_0_8_um_filter_53_9]|nr:MAG: hypothetical protein COY40_03190 [Alphaproteobacteria bacterium CG_4_10_14_0_8_um_filter_53_9]
MHPLFAQAMPYGGITLFLALMVIAYKAWQHGERKKTLQYIITELQTAEQAGDIQILRKSCAADQLNIFTILSSGQDFLYQMRSHAETGQSQGCDKKPSEMATSNLTAFCAAPPNIQLQALMAVVPGSFPLAPTAIDTQTP